MFKKMASPPHCVQGCSTEQGTAWVCQCQCSVRLPLRHFAPSKPLGLKKKGRESLRRQSYYPQSWCPPATSRAKGCGLGPQAGVTCLTGGTAKAKVTCCIQCVLHLLGRRLWSLGCLLLQLLSGYGLQLHSVGTSSPSPAPCQRNAHRGGRSREEVVLKY